MPVQSVIDRRITTMAGGVAGGDYKLKSQHGFVFDMLVSASAWSCWWRSGCCGA